MYPVYRLHCLQELYEHLHLKNTFTYLYNAEMERSEIKEYLEKHPERLIRLGEDIISPTTNIRRKMTESFKIRKTGCTNKAELLTLAAEKNHSFIFKIGNSWFESRKDHAAFTEYYEKLKPNQKCHMEVVLAGKPVKPYFDIELKGIDEIEDFDADEAGINVIKWIKGSFKKHFGITIKNADLAVCDASNEEKWSMRIIVNKEDVFFADNSIQKVFMDIALSEASDFVKSCVDSAVYDKDRAMRICESYKDVNGLFVRPFKTISNHEIESFLITNPVGTNPLQCDAIDEALEEQERSNKAAEERRKLQLATPVNEHTVREIREILMEHLGPEHYGQRKHWFGIVAAVKCVLGEAGYDLAREFSARAGDPQYDNDFPKNWESISPDHNWSMESLYKYVKGGSSALRCNQDFRIDSDEEEENEKPMQFSEDEPEFGNEDADALILKDLFAGNVISVSSKSDDNFYIYNPRKVLWETATNADMNDLVGVELKKYLAKRIEKMEQQIQSSVSQKKKELSPKLKKSAVKAFGVDRNLNSTRTQLKSAYKQAGGSRHANGIIVKLKSKLLDASFKAKLDKDPYSLAIAGNKMLNLLTGVTRQRVREDYCTFALDVDYTPGSDLSIAQSFFSDVMCGDAEMIEYFQRVMGYCLLGNNAAHLMFFFLGRGSNGKSLILQILEAILKGQFFTWMVQGIMKAGKKFEHQMPKLVAEVTTAMRYADDPVHQWIAAQVVKKAGDWYVDEEKHQGVIDEIDSDYDEDEDGDMFGKLV
ncbi:hypothetical protein CAOG_01746 [Capsaspora owczarzaki ATCC 30864]|uniref:hypothetical protein n=1 Tax=Capsaspora owczarzaki (strain ATCC 30864) TaxID=595528 RepID=UPI0001FE36AF|nr:hypothetical protein CAOG_01746 [Capsaspora owczarzaki ATCC 30864]|eukprot:XP_004364614.1 hypothetical protein CAOG_01746 [Capsaspora owczarzaki ATCC 30864]